ncbi:MAG: YggT family protein [Actinobacteria bacterium]|jgi:YggT family protein|nr:YggT family protein [Actinomycetota bacterium]NCW83234.1 YggT family protein [Acidimicrobiia bacterium]NDC99155.1 YggT family protein [bacterium]HBQ52377.1 YggT family protein [Acidimicrobium sp.]NBO97192.1 YggT family protein [Actinomycetota bacterium]
MIELLCTLVQIFIYMIIVRVVLSWFPSTSGGVVAQISYFVGRFTEPVLDWVRRVMPRTGALDLSPLVVLLFLQIVVQRMILKC